MKSRKKLIEVALPLDAINKASAREKSIRHGHPSTLHLWWARRPLAAARAVLFAQTVDDPSEYVDVLLSHPPKKRAAQRELQKRNREEGSHETTLEEVIADLERDRLFGIIENLIKWESTTNEEVLRRARDEIWQSWRRACADYADHQRAKELFDRYTLPGFHDPFAGGGALPLEAQRLGFDTIASDLNPVAVLINKAMIEIPPRFAGMSPVNPEAQKDVRLFDQLWRGAEGLAADVAYYGKWMRDEAYRRIGHLYPPVQITTEMVQERPDLEPYKGTQLPVIAWLWARTVKSPNPAFAEVDVPLISSFLLSTRRGKEVYLEPVLEHGDYRFVVRVGRPEAFEEVKVGTKVGRRGNFRCLLSGTPIPNGYIREEGKAGRIGTRLMAIVAQGNRGRVYFPASHRQEVIADIAALSSGSATAISQNTRAFAPPLYGMETFDQLFTERQLLALTTLSDLVTEVQAKVRNDARAMGIKDDGVQLKDGGSASTAYAEAVAVYLALVVDKAADYWSNICTWHASREVIRNVFGRQAIPMVWDYAEANGFSGATGSLSGCIRWIRKALLTLPAAAAGMAEQRDAQKQTHSAGRIVSTDPPYYDNIGYADLSDFFYTWLRPSLRSVFPKLFATLAVPKADELVATAHRHGDKAGAEAFFLGGMGQAMRRLAEQAHPAFPVTIYYAFKQSETKGKEGTSSTGWETFLEAVIKAGFSVTGTWPMRTELKNRMVGLGTNALASSIVLVCRHTNSSERAATRHTFVTALKAELPQALISLQHSNIAPVDLAQAAIGPGMAVYTRYGRVLDVEGNVLSVRDALGLINQMLDETLAEQEGDFDADSRWALAWFEQCGFDEGEYGVAETLSKAKNTSVEGLVSAGILTSRGGKVRLLAPKELSADWDPVTDQRLTDWEIVHHLIQALEADGERGAGSLVAKVGTRAESARDLCYRLYNLCERKDRAVEGLGYNGLVQSWPEIMRLSRTTESPVAEPGSLFED